jgi:hypothetical protein
MQREWAVEMCGITASTNVAHDALIARLSAICFDLAFARLAEYYMPENVHSIPRRPGLSRQRKT